MEKIFELKTSNGKKVTWNGKNGLDACKRYVDCHPNETIVAWRHPKNTIAFGLKKIED